MLRAAGVAFEARGSGVDEDALKSEWLTDGATPLLVAERLAACKALAVSRAEPGLVIGADSTLELDGRLFDKAGSMEEARARLIELRGRAHSLHSAVALAREGAVVWSEVGTAVLHVRPFTEAWLDGYIAQAGDAVTSSVGAYHLEGVGVQLFERIEGDWFTILGMPMLGLLEALRREGALPA
ncbi:MAG TPA: Maf family protein [Caulobacteraceae bacterium]|jgi:septum formation protein